jgi:hypothetical protein
MMFAQRLHNTPYNTQAEKVHTYFLRIATGSIKGIATDVLYHDVHGRPVMYHWVVLAARWWTKLSVSRDEPRYLAGCVWREDVSLALAGSPDVGPLVF